MRPESPTPYQGPERTPVQEHGVGVERPVEVTSSETGIEAGAERFERRADNNAITSDVGITTTLPTPVIDDMIIDDNTTTDTPIVAGDDDLIEKEWVDKAKKIVAETKSDPYRREEQVNKLQVDYLKKRYGRELGAAE